MLEVANVTVSYGRHRALEGASLKVGKGEICVILGANGAGKSTLLKTIAGIVHAENGSTIVMNGKTITGMKPHRIVEEGIALVPEGRGIFGDLTVAENLQLGAFANRARRHEAETLKLVYSLFPKLAERRKQIARTMSGGEQQMVAIGRALMSKPDILMLDEPSLGLSPLLSQELFRSLAEVAKTGVGILLVEQNARQSLKIAGRGYLIENGQVTGENTAQALMNDPAVVAAYLGGAGGGRQKAAQPRITLPAPMRLPASVEAMGRALGDFAQRAGRISQAFVRASRRDAAMPSAFVGRYDPKAGADPWQDIAGPSAPTSAGAAGSTARRSPDAERLADQAAGLARRASERLAAHVRSARLSTPRPVAFDQGRQGEGPAISPARTYSSRVAHEGLSEQATPPPPKTAAASLSIADLASHAARIHADHIAAKRRAMHGGIPEQPEKPAPPPAAEAPVLLNGTHGLIGHNSAGFDDEPPASPRPASGLSIGDLAARAAQIHAAHIAARRSVSPIVTRPAPTETAKPAAPEKTFVPNVVRDPVRIAVPGSIADLVARAATVHSSHVAAGRKRLAAFTIPASPSAGKAKTGSAEGKRKKNKET
jgi:branched-chain amino acid transport system ATP-binding protein